jgi:2,4-dienoyl-CoA reductase (NADPH2)
VHKRFAYQTFEDLQAEAGRLNLPIALEKDLASLHRQVAVYHLKTPNALAVQPMEGCDGTGDGKPGELTYRRYQRFASGGAGLIWFEATAVTPEGRANPRQLLASDANTGDLARLLESSSRAARDTFGAGYSFVPVIQLTHSGRYSKPEGPPRPVIAQHNPYLDPKNGIGPDYPVIGDAELERLEDEYVRAAGVALEAGFPIVDVKCCHRYLISELLGSHLREGRYGGSFANRTRFLLNIVDKIKTRFGNRLQVAVRLNVWDGLPYPYGWGAGKATAGMEPGSMPLDLTEPKMLLGELERRGVKLVNVTVGNPYYNPHLNRPYDQPSLGMPLPEESPLAGVARMAAAAGELQQAFPELVIMGSGYSWLRHLLGYAAAGQLSRGLQRIAGVGREAFAYPEFARDLLEKGRMEPEKTCIACSKCTDIMRHGGAAGCVIRDGGAYLPIYRECVKK